MLDHIPKELTSVSDDHKTPSARVLKFSSMHSNAPHHPELEKNLETRVTITSKPRPQQMAIDPANSIKSWLIQSAIILHKRDQVHSIGDNPTQKGIILTTSHRIYDP